MWSDPQAARAVMRSPVGKIVVPLNVSQSPGLTFDDIDRLTGADPINTSREMISGLMHYAVRANRQKLPREEVSLLAESALAVASRAARFSTESVFRDSQTSGDLTSGMTVLYLRPFV